jgi:hypothetical protein
MLPETRAVTLPVSVSTPPFRGGNGNNTSLETAGQRHSPTEMAVIFPDLTSRRLYESARLSASHGLTSGVHIRLLHSICTNYNAITNSCTNSNIACRVHVAYIRRMDLISASPFPAPSPDRSALVRQSSAADAQPRRVREPMHPLLVVRGMNGNSVSARQYREIATALAAEAGGWTRSPRRPWR